MSEERWVEVSKSQFAHETEGLNYLRDRLPTHSPYRAWTNFEFRDNRGRWHEVDALVLTQSRLHLVELKYYSGRLHGNDHLWLRDGRPAEDSPLLLARRKAQYLASKLKDELVNWVRETKAAIPDQKKIVPFVQESVFLHHPQLVSALPASSAINLYGLDEAENTSHLPGISALLAEQPWGTPIGPNQEHILAALLERIGLVQRREREAGSWIIEEDAIGEGPGWQDWRAYHKVAKETLARIRFQVSAPGAPASERAEQLKIAQHEYSVMSKLSHDGIVAPRDLVESELGVGLVYDDTKTTERLDLWLAGRNGLAMDRQLDLVRQLGETLAYAHSHKVVHRGLSPRAVWVQSADDGAWLARIGDWKSAGLAAAEQVAESGVTTLAQKAAADDPWLEAFLAPEERWAKNADRIRIDVFGLGALAYYILTSKAPAASEITLQERLRAENGLDLSLAIPEIPEGIRQAVLRATRPAPSERTGSIAAFLQDLDAASTPDPTTLDEPTDPLEAKPGAVLGNRFEVLKRLGRGSTALGLLVKDAEDDGAERVLKVALDSRAEERLDGEAEVLRTLKGDRLVSLVKGDQPLTVDGRRALLLESAGTETLADVLRGQRLSLDYLDRYGEDLLRALIQLDTAGVDHRDIKPSNLGVKESRRGKHLMLFDFSLSRASAAALQAGTPPYLDPFLGGSRQVFDSAAERYSAAVVLFEMATGSTPFYGDRMANPATVKDEVTLDPSQFDPAIAAPLVQFFRKALARDAAARHHTATQMLELWKAAFTATPTTMADNANELAEAATLATPLEKAGFSARALSAVERFGVTTVGDLIAVDGVRLNHLSGSADVTRREVKKRASYWRKKFGSAAAPAVSGGTLPSPRAIAETLEATSGAKRGTAKLSLLRVLLGIEAGADAFATHQALGNALGKPVGSQRVNQVLDELQDAWAEAPLALAKLTELGSQVATRLNELGGVATVAELTDAVLDSCAREDSKEERRIAEGLLRVVAVDRARALKRAEAEGAGFELRRRAGTVILIARTPELLDLAEQLGRDADRLLADTPGGDAALVPAERAAATLAATARTVADAPASLTAPARLVRLAGALSKDAAASGAGELHSRDLTASSAVRMAFAGLAGAQRISRHEVQDRVRVRFPKLAPLPGDSRLDAVVEQARLDLRFNPDSGVYETPDFSAASSSGTSRLSTHTRFSDTQISSSSVTVQRLTDSVERRSFLALGVHARQSASLARVLVDQYGAVQFGVTAALIEAIRGLPKAPPWEVLEAADAAATTSRDGKGLAAVVRAVLPQLEARLAELVADDGGTRRPVLLTEAAPLARYQHADVIRRWSDMTLSRGQAVWVILPQTDANRGALLDGVSVTTSPNQFLAVDSAWIDAHTPNTLEGVAP